MGVEDGRGLLVEVVEFAPGLFVAALFRRVVDWQGLPWWVYRRHAGGGSIETAVQRLDVPETVTVVQNLHQVEWQQ